MQGKVQLLLEQTKERTFRDPCAYYANGIWHVYYSLVQNEEDGQYFYLAESTSADLKEWGEPRILSERGKHLNYSSPGNVFAADGMYHICLQTYPRTKGELYGDENSRVFLMSSPDLVNWEYLGHTPCSENVCVLKDEEYFYIFHSPRNGIGLLRSKDLKEFEDWDYKSEFGLDK